jgi:hypothetical protein
VVRASKPCRSVFAWSVLAAAGSAWLCAPASAPVATPAAVVQGHLVDVTGQYGVLFLHQAPWIVKISPALFVALVPDA